MFESLTKINNTHTYTAYYCMVIGSILSGSLYKMAVSAQNSWTSTYDTTNRSTCNFITRFTFYTQELSLIRTNLAMTKFKQLVNLCEGRKSCDTGMRRYYHGRRKVHYQGRAMLMITYSSHTHCTASNLFLTFSWQKSSPSYSWSRGASLKYPSDNSITCCNTQRVNIFGYKLDNLGSATLDALENAFKISFSKN